MNEVIKDKIRACLMGQLVGDSIGAQVEFKSISGIKDFFGCNHVDMCGGGTFSLACGQITDDSEMAIALASSIINAGEYNAEEAMKEYRKWLKSNPFDVGRTIYSGITGNPNPSSLANGALMRISPLAAFMWNRENDEIANAAMEDCKLTHPNPLCCELNALYALFIANIIRTGDMVYTYNNVVRYAEEHFSKRAKALTVEAAHRTHIDFLTHAGFVEIAYQNAVYCFLHKMDFKDVMDSTIMSGGDTDTNAAIAGALYGAYCGLNDIPESWKNAIMNCMPTNEKIYVENYSNDTAHPRPMYYWPSQLIVKGEELIKMSSNNNSN